MAEAEDVITDAAYHASAYIQALWRRHHPVPASDQTISLLDLTRRLDLLITAALGTSYRIRAAQAPSPTTWLARLSQPHAKPRVLTAIPATDGQSIWLPGNSDVKDPALAIELFRAAALQQAMRAQRGSAQRWGDLPSPLARDIYLLLEAQSADAAIARQFPGLVPTLNRLRQNALAARPPLSHFCAERQGLETLVRTMLAQACDCPKPVAPAAATPHAAVGLAQQLAEALMPHASSARRLGPSPLLKDWWTGQLIAPGTMDVPLTPQAAPMMDDANAATRSARLHRRPHVRQAENQDQDRQSGAWMVQSTKPHEHAQDPMGMQRPADRDTHVDPSELASSLSELPQASLVSTPDQAKEFLLSDDPPAPRSVHSAVASNDKPMHISYPEWDYRSAAYRQPGATVSLSQAPEGAQAWVDETIRDNQWMLNTIRRRFDMLRAQRTRLRRQVDGDEVDLEAFIERRIDALAGLPTNQALYETHRRSRQDLAILLLIDVSGSTDAWVSSRQRVIDVERQALLLVCHALKRADARYAVQAFSGCGPQAVNVRTIKSFDEAFDDNAARRIAGLEPERYTRAGAAIRHASATLMRQSATHRLLLILSDGKPNDVDAYAGRYGVEDMRQAVKEAVLQGMHPFCLTVDQCAAGYLPAIFGAGQFALLTKPQTLPFVLLDWIRRLISAQ